MTRTDERRERLARQQQAGEWLRQAREAAGYSGTRFAAALGVHQAQVSKYETGISKPDDDRAREIARLLGLDEIDVRRKLGLWIPESLEPRPMTPEEAIRIDQTLRPAYRGLLLAVLSAVRSQQQDASVSEGATRSSDRLQKPWE
ncbi:helix-turn-helix domain-containing protein [Protofrankia coriariae]|uniref:HTH cro/C1-type domain-containing protein n=1 Tax=Protofrankia coriariae TaxID=1562887 RepID=A0ABR5F499_9ACTN|nr:helix-turn-helix transcriptional regulator [Protofrankia coriariae]KLL11549.1 hypothetical protein FrCorBMG51_10935 [Protofrankia coriariae]